MRWSKSGAQIVLALRCIHASGRTAEFWKHWLIRPAAANDSLASAA